MKYIAVVFSLLIIFLGVVISGDDISFYASMAAFFLVSFAETVHYTKFKKNFLVFLPICYFILSIISILGMTGFMFTMIIEDGVRYIQLDSRITSYNGNIKVINLFFIIAAITTFLTIFEKISLYFRKYSSEKCASCNQMISKNA